MTIDLWSAVSCLNYKFEFKFASPDILTGDIVPPVGVDKENCSILCPLTALHPFLVLLQIWCVGITITQPSSIHPFTLAGQRKETKKGDKERGQFDPLTCKKLRSLWLASIFRIQILPNQMRGNPGSVVGPLSSLAGGQSAVSGCWSVRCEVGPSLHLTPHTIWLMTGRFWK